MEGEAEELPRVGDGGGDHPRHLKVPKAMAPGRMRPWVMGKLSGEGAEPLFVIFEKSWQSGGGLTDCKRENITQIFNRGIKGERCRWEGRADPCKLWKHLDPSKEKKKKIRRI